MEIDAQAVLNFWFNDTTPNQWFAKDPAFDALVRHHFLDLTRRAIAGELAPWSESPQHGLALLLLLDQFPRQLWRDSAMAFAGDTRALALSLQALDRGWVEAEPDQARRQFWLMPLMHSEQLAVQEASLPLFSQFVDERTADFALRAGVERRGAGLSAATGLRVLSQPRRQPLGHRQQGWSAGGRS